MLIDRRPMKMGQLLIMIMIKFSVSKTKSYKNQLITNIKLQMMKSICIPKNVKLSFKGRGPWKNLF